MSSGNQILVIERAGGAFVSVMEELDQLGFRVVWVPTLDSALEFIKGSPKLSLIVVSAAIADNGGADFMGKMREISPTLPIIWGTRPNSPKNAERGASPNSLIPEPIRSDVLRSTVSILLAEHFYPKAIADSVKDGAIEVLGRLGEFRVEGGAFLVANQTALSDFSSIIAFSGHAKGHLMMSMTSEHARALYQCFVPGAVGASVDRLEDLVGELCNQILGRINAFFVSCGLEIQQTTPIFIRAAGSTMRYPGRHPSFAVQLTNGQERVALEYYLAEFDKSRLHEASAGAVLNAGEIRHF